MSKKASGRRGPAMRQQIVDPRGGSAVANKGAKSKGKPSSEHISGRRKSWLSLRETTDGRGNDSGQRSGQPWWKSPAMKAERLRRAASRKLEK
jgi:hypothetical protein